MSNRDVIVDVELPGAEALLLRALLAGQHDLPHNGIFVVDNADRRRIDDQWNGSVGAPPAVTDAEWHDVRVEYDADSGEIAAYVDGASEPLMTATDTTFSGGRVGFGSFDNFGRARHFRAVGTVP